ncbi:hypothetical protein E5675_12260 [Sphingopyxis sp. PAMC25046]|uniref:hypothetical protein n=1 Tax=Sphingopyxis sp. PAMC25046 TaxID=2565556 RepID=UPI00109DD3E4|nr:hypothetical protein [Sphingopyxis sp. PAMC25046]QCB55127.1 hypothetical protein E5675_12260 [Sphingopyxis sp. PAMC25046]
MMPRLLRLLLLPLALSGCNALPRDASGTTEQIERTGTMRVAVLPATPDAAPALALLRSYAARHKARLTRIAVHGEHALHWLEDGRIDAVVGHFAKASPWMADISLSKPVARAEPDDSRQPVLRIARRNGENALILATDRAVAGSAK